MGPTSIAVIGGGSWATALVKILSENASDRGYTIRWWVRSAETARHISHFHHNPNYLSAVQLNPKVVQVTTDLNEAIENSQLLIFAIPAAFLHETINSLPPGLLASKKVVSAIKGMIPEYKLIVGEYLNTSQGVSLSELAVITGPCHAEEVALEKLSYLTIASQDEKFAEDVASIISCRFIHTTVSDDIFGTEFAAVLKNIYAIASGICHGLGYGDNFQAVLISNALSEMERFIAAAHPINRDTNDSAYLGDLLVTAYSQFSRNRNFGAMLGKGYSVKAAQLEMNMIAEGYYSSRIIHEMNEEYKASLPIVDAVFNIIYGGVPARKEIESLSAVLR